jgi:chaperone required for assembly of F1-ATPase
MQPAQPARQKRFYTTVSLGRDASGFRIELDGKPIKTPARATLVLPTEQLAAAVADEWRGQGEFLDWNTLGLTKLANTTLDAVAANRDQVAADIVRYAGFDLICYRAETPGELRRRQDGAWNPILATYAERGMHFQAATGIQAVQQPDEAISGIADQITKLDNFALAAAHVMTSITGSVLLTMAHVDGRMGCDELWALSRIDEAWQAEHWGLDYEAEQRDKNRHAELHGACAFYALSRS